MCEKCKTPFETSPIETKTVLTTLAGVLPKTEDDVKKAKEDIGYDILPMAGRESYTMYKAVGCKACSKGYKGRIGIYEVFAITTDMEKMLSQHATTTDVQNQAQKDGMITMKQDGYLKALSGLTTLEEVARVAADF
ncbi:hypothetical protein IPG36_02695 [bacterium]|nr:MAG: hypothetical protein IPG36_02695 [bacterium]